MTKREAVLILGVRESASKSEIRERHRKMMLLNHPDSGNSIIYDILGGCPYIASKVNQAKELIIHDAPDFKI
jgi:DnaJ family protein C protein 19